MVHILHAFVLSINTGVFFAGFLAVCKKHGCWGECAAVLSSDLIGAQGFRFSDEAALASDWECIPSNILSSVLGFGQLLA